MSADATPAQSCVIGADASGLVTTFSAEAERLLDLPAEEIVGKLTLQGLLERLAARDVDGAELERLRLVNRSLLSILSHDIRTPLTGIQGFSEMIRDEDWSAEEVKEFAGDINRAARRLDEMISRMLDIGRAESPR